MGWEPQRYPDSIKAAADSVFAIENIFRSKSYWIALHSAGSILGERGVTEILHNKPQGYYECLLHLPVDKLGAMLADADFPRYKNQDFLRLLTGEGVDIAPLALADGPALAIDDGVADFAAMVPAPIMPQARPFQRRFGDGMFKVMFD
eukprot:8127367-Pyramimonas_sp.AAC.1